MKASEFNVNKVWDFIESRPFYNKNYMPKFNTAEEIWAEWGTAEKRMYAKFDWEDTYGNKLHPKEVANRRRQGNYSALAGLKESKKQNTMKASELKQIIREEVKQVVLEESLMDKIKSLFVRTPLEVKLLNKLDTFDLIAPGDEKFNIVIKAAKQMGMDIDKTKASEIIQKKLAMEIESLK